MFVLQLPDWLDDLGSLREVNASFNRLCSTLDSTGPRRLTDCLPSKMFAVPQDPAYAVDLRLSGNFELLNFTDVVLATSRPVMTQLPSWLRELTMLRNLTAKGGLQRLDDSMVASWEHLHYLDVSGNDLEPDGLPARVFRVREVKCEQNHKLAAVKELDLSSQHLKQFPDCLYSFTGLERLNISRNKLKGIPFVSGLRSRFPLLESIDL